MRFINNSKTKDKPAGEVVDLHRNGLGRIFAKPGETVDVPEWAASPKLGSNGGRLPSIIESLCPQLTPADEKERAEWLKPPVSRRDAVRAAVKAAPDGIPDVEILVKAGMSPGAARSKVAKMQADQQLAQMGDDD